MKKISLIIMTSLFVFSVAYAQTGEIKGIVKRDKTGEPLFGATVHIEVGGVKQGVSTDPDGKYTIKPVRTGVYTIFVSVMGYKKFELYEVNVVVDKTTYADFDMEIAIKEIDAFTVVAQRYEVPLISRDEPHVKTITAKMIQQSVGKHNPVGLVAEIPGFKLAPNGKDVYMRGSRPQSTQFITDGMRSITGKIGIPGLAIGSIKVYTGGVPAAYGNLTGGVIIVETQSYFNLAQSFK